MSAHLTNEDLLQYFAGEETQRIRLHLQECAECKGEAERTLAIIGGARSRAELLTTKDAYFWTRQRNNIRTRMADRKAGRPSWSMVAALALLLIASAFMFRTQQPRQVVAGVSTTSQASPAVINDNALLSSVDEAIERDVPSAMAPLQKLAFEREQAERQSNRRN